MSTLRAFAAHRPRVNIVILALYAFVLTVDALAAIGAYTVYSAVAS